MNYDEFINDVKTRARIATGDEAQEACCSTLNVLGQRLSPGKKAMLAGRIPAELSECLKQIPNNEQFGISEFYRRVAEREEVDVSVASENARAVGHALQDALGRTEFEELISVLPYDYDELFGLNRVERTGARAA